MSKILAPLLLSLLLVGVVSFTSNVSGVTESGTVYIRSDGSISPSTSPVFSFDNVTYKLRDDIIAGSFDGVAIERDNTILDGAGFALEGNMLEDSNGIYMNGVTNVTIRNISIRSFHNGVYQDRCFYCCIEETSLYHNGYGIYFQFSSFNTISGNNISENSFAGIWLELSQNNTICKNGRIANYITSSGIGGIKLQEGSNFNNITENCIGSNSVWSIYIENSWVNIISHNNFDNYAYSDSSGNLWDNGYAEGGNFWRNYNGTDLCSGPSQNLTGSDGIGDTPYIISSTNIDYYPLMKPYLFGDMDGNGRVDMKDIAIVGAAFDTVLGDPRWNPMADINRDGVVNMRDVALVAKHFGDHL